MTLDRLVPPDFSHVALYPARALRSLQRTVEKVEVTTIPLPASYRLYYDQGEEGACVGEGESLLCSINNRKKYDPFWLYNEARLLDGFPMPHDGTTLSAGFDVLREKGHRRFRGGKAAKAAELDEGIVEVNRWLNTTDEARTAIADGHAIVDGVNWYEHFDAQFLVEKRVKIRGRERVEYWIPPRATWGRVAGGHCICRPLASDERQAFGWINSWGQSYPWPVWMAYDDRDWLQHEQGEAAIVTDR